LVEKAGVPGENHQPVTSHWQTLWQNVVSSTPRQRGFELITAIRCWNCSLPEYTWNICSSELINNFLFNQAEYEPVSGVSLWPDIDDLYPLTVDAF
jgi:hypothetical protein